jgi:hypothetical protein
VGDEGGRWKAAGVVLNLTPALSNKVGEGESQHTAKTYMTITIALNFKKS